MADDQLNALGTVIKTAYDGEPRTEAEIYISTPAPTILAQDTPTLIAGTYTEVIASGFSTTAAGRIICTNPDGFEGKITAIGNLDPASGSNNLYDIQIAKQGTPIESSKMEMSLDNNNPQVVACQSLVSLAQNEYVEAFIEAEGHSTNATANKLTVCAI